MASVMLRSTLRTSLLIENCFAQKAAFSVSSTLSAERKYTKKHEWVSVENGVGTVGITDYAAGSLGDVVYVELPEVGKEIEKGDAAGAVESVKAASDVYSPISGTVTEVNTVLETESGLINKSPFEEGWIFKLQVKDTSELSQLLNEKDYEAHKNESDNH